MDEEEIETMEKPCNGCGANEWRREESYKFALLICIHCGRRVNVAHKGEWKGRSRRFH